MPEGVQAITIPASGHSISLIQHVQFEDGMKMYRINLDGIVFDLGIWRNEVSMFVQATDTEPLPTYLEPLPTN